jgi:hypothetical protein
MSHSLDDEHRRLLAVTDALEREHENLHQRPGDREAHIAHRDKLRRHIADLHDYIARLRQTPG